MNGMLNIAEPSNFYEASKSSEWKEAMKEEYESIIKNNTWDLVKIPHDKQPIGCKWLFKLKFKADVSIDDLITTGSADNLIEEIKQQLSQKFEMKDLGEMHYYLGLEVWRDSSQTLLSQGKHAKSLLTKFKMDECKAAFVPLQQNNKLQVIDGSKYADATLYRQLVGSLIYLTTTRPDLAYAVSVLSQFMTQPHENHWLAAKGVLRYLQL
eukprot:PITA_22095